jgi:hypothetical protein
MERAFRSLSLLMPRRGGAQSASFIARRIAPNETNYNPRRGGRVAGAACAAAGPDLPCVQKL